MQSPALQQTSDFLARFDRARREPGEPRIIRAVLFATVTHAFTQFTAFLLFRNPLTARDKLYP